MHLKSHRRYFCLSKFLLWHFVVSTLAAGHCACSQYNGVWVCSCISKGYTNCSRLSDSSVLQP